MKIYKWIDKYNKRYCFKINSKYYRAKDRGRSNYYRLHPKFYPYYLVRLTAITVGLILLKKNILEGLKNTIKKSSSSFYNPDNYNSISIQSREIFLTLFGYRYFEPTGILPLLSEREILNSNLSFKEEKKPEVSIIIPVYNQLAFTFNCLKSIQLNLPKNHTIEIILVDDCSTDRTEEFFKNNVSGIRYIRNIENKGFLLNCNNASKMAKGKFLYFLNNDTQVTSSWLDQLIKPFDNENTGAVGSKLIYGHGLLQEAGGIIFHDASGANYGRNDLPGRPRFNYLREVDYCSGASLIVRKSDFEKLGGFDEQLVPAYYEDTDLCFAIRNQLNKQVIYQPLSEIIHFEGITSGKIAKKNSVKSFQNINKNKFHEKWKEALQDHNNEFNIQIASRRLLPKKRLVFIDNIIPAYDKNSGSFRAFQILKIIKDLGYHITFIPDDANKTQPYYNSLVKLGVEVLFRYPNRPGMIRELNFTLDKCDVVWISRPEMNFEFKWLLEKFPNAKWIYDTVDLHHIRIERQAIQTNDKKLLQEASKVKIQELEIAKAANFTFTVTEDEKVMLEKEGIKNVKVIPNIHEPEDITNNLDFEEREGLLFIGAYDHPPNIDAVVWLVNEIMPEIWKEIPHLKLTLLGSKPTGEVLQLRSDLVDVPGFVQDVSGYFSNHRLFVAPLRFGAGMKGKIGQSLAFKLPVITTDIGAEGMGLIEGENVMVANTKDEFIAKILSLYKNKKTWSKISNNCLKALEPYSISAVKSTLEKIL